MKRIKKQRYTTGTEYKQQIAVSPKTKYSTFNLDQQIKTTFNVGELIPFYMQEVLPGDEFKISTAQVTRTTTLLAPMMDNLYMDIYYFYVPNRIIWENWVQLMGENKGGAWAQTKEYTVPNIDFSTVSYDEEKGNSNILKNPLQYMGIPMYFLNKAQGSKNTEISALPGRAYKKIFDDWFRDENLQEPPLINLDDTPDKAENQVLYMANKYTDYFTKALPSAQKGNPITVNLGGELPLINKHKVSQDKGFEYSNKDNFIYLTRGLRDENGNAVETDQTRVPQIVTISSNHLDEQDMNRAMNNILTFDPNNSKPDNGIPTLEGIAADASKATGISINDLRMAFALQKMLEKDARGGNRYVETIETHFGVRANDARLQRSEYLGGLHQLINTQQVSQTTPTAKPDATTDDGLGALGAYSLTNAYTKNFDHFFEEHGLIIGIACVRYNHTYQQGIKKTWLRKTRNQFYDPTFANIGEQPIYNAEIFANNDDNDMAGFGFQEAWADYRYNPSMTTGMMNSYYKQPLDYWHMADKYDTLPTLTQDWIKETPTNFDRITVIGHEITDQIQTDILVQNKATRPMPVYSIPGNIDMD